MSVATICEVIALEKPAKSNLASILAVSLFTFVSPFVLSSRPLKSVSSSISVVMSENPNLALKDIPAKFTLFKPRFILLPFEPSFSPSSPDIS